MNFSVNQVRNLYVGNSIGTANTTPTTKGEICPCGVAGKNIYFKSLGAAGLECSPLIDVDKITKATLTKYANLCTKLHSKIITINEAVVGQTYTIKVLLRNYIGMSEDDTTVRIGAFTAKTGATTSTIAAGLAASLIANTKNEKLFSVSVANNVITITEVEQDWVLGKMPVAIVHFDIALGSIMNDTLVDYDWADVTNGADVPTNDGIKKLADLEYFAHGTRGDIYRGMGYPRNIETQYLINMASTYDVINIHYHYSGQGLESYNSEADLQILVPAGNTTLAAAINTLTGKTSGDAFIAFTVAP